MAQFRLIIIFLAYLLAPLSATNVFRRQGNSECAQWCAANFAHPGNPCTAPATRGEGPCYECGPKGPQPPTKILCNERCVPIDNDNCGTCGNKCTNGQQCIGGVCKCSSGTLGDNDNCGTCGNKCTNGQQCIGGVCKCPSGTLGDNSNCGTCGNACPSGRTCSGGQCQCPSGQTECGGQCRNFQTDPQNCGLCGHVCTGGQQCIGGVCKCSSGTLGDNSNCAACFRADENQHRLPSVEFDCPGVPMPELHPESSPPFCSGSPYRQGLRHLFRMSWWLSEYCNGAPRSSGGQKSDRRVNVQSLSNIYRLE